jgi:hypothetical protein
MWRLTTRADCEQFYLMLRRNIYCCFVLFSFLGSVGTGFAQVRSGSIVGLVVDPSGAPIPEAAVTVLALETNIKS